MNGLAIGIAGTAKNTGKTTTTTAILETLDNSNHILGLTSIGYDGEQIDNVTGLPKPRIKLKAGYFLATAEKCLKASSAALKVLKQTDMITPLGRIVYTQVVEEGLVVVAGPNKSSQLEKVINDLRGFGCSLILVDGALNRLAPLVKADGLMLATGAARQPEIELLALETKALSHIINLPVTTLSFDANETRFLLGEAGVLRPIPLQFIIEKEDVIFLARHLNRATQIVFIPGIVAAKCWKPLADLFLERDMPVELVARDPLKILVSGNIREIYRNLRKLEERGSKVKVLKTIPLLGITVNPFYPKFRYEANDYEPAYVDRNLLLQKLRDQVRVPVFDVVAEGGQGLVQIITSFIRKRN